MTPLLCADDFGMTAGISEGILTLCRAGSLQATSVMTEGPLLRQYAEQLKTLPVQRGLHFNLTENFGSGCYSLQYLMLCPVLPVSVKQDILRRLRQQMQTFEDIFGCPPDFIDGHRHVHVFPSIRNIFLDEVQKRYGNAAKKPWVRQVGAGFSATDTPLKLLVLNILNAGFRNTCKKYGFTTNDDFSGVYSFSLRAPYKLYLEQWLMKAAAAETAQTLIMCHPSNRLEPEDPISAARHREFSVLSSVRR